jgi:hypothetical protein
MIITTEKEVQFNHEKIKVGVIEPGRVQKAEFHYLVIDGKVKVIKNPKK